MPNYECPFRLGDTVIPIEPAEDEVNRPPFWVDEMEEYLGWEAKVVRIDTMSNFYILRLDISEDYNWRDSWLKFVREDGYPWLWHTSWISPVIEYTLF